MQPPTPLTPLTHTSHSPAPPHAAVYDFLNYTGLSWYPTSNCWLFPQPAISLIYGGAPYQIAFLATTTDTSAGADVAQAYCQ